MTIQKRRTDKGWTQEQLAQHSGVSVRTIQRVETGAKATLETLKCLAATFDVSIVDLVQEQKMPDQAQMSSVDVDQRLIERQALEYVESLKVFHVNWISALVVIPCLLALNIYISPQTYWILAVIGGWSIAIALHAVFVFGAFNVLGAEWEQREFQKRMNLLKR